MHYPLSSGGEELMRNKFPVSGAIGQRNGLSDLDIKKVKAKYCGGETGDIPEWY